MPRKINPLTRKEWLSFILLAILSCVAWHRFSYSQFSILNISVDKKDALNKASEFLSIKQQKDISDYLKTVVLKGDYWADVYLQRVLGFKQEEAFIRANKYEFFYWVARFFKENEKEEYRVFISPSTNEIIGFAHLIEDTQERKPPEQEDAKRKAKEFLQDTYNINFKDYVLHEERLIKFDKRTDYEFSWEKKDVYIPWKDSKDSGGAKLLIKAIISGDEVREFYKARLDIPEKFSRFVENNLYFGQWLASISFLILFFWLIVAMVILFKRREEIRISRSFRFYLFIGISLLVFGILEEVNGLNNILFGYNTSSSVVTFFGLYFVGVLTSIIFTNLAFAIPGVCAEYLSFKVFPDKKENSFFHYIRTTIFSRYVSKLILFGYLLCVILLGLQSVFIYFGNRYLGLWIEQLRLVRVSASLIPFYSAFFISLQAGFSEEVIFRLFGINWAKRYLKSTILAVLFTSLVWGFGHSNYPIFPVWFRGVEVTILGIIYGVVYLRYGLIPLLVAHYLFDAYWGSAAYIFGNSTPYLFGGSIFVILIPSVFAIAGYILNRKDEEKPLEETLTSKQLYNSEVLAAYINKKLKEGASLKQLEKELTDYGWDITLVRFTIKRLERD